MGRIAVGADLGTSTSLVSVCMPDGQPRLLRDRQGIGIIPSVVSIDADSRAIVGQRAKDRLVLDPANTFFSTKRFIGRDMREEKNQWAATQYSYQIVAGENGIPMVKAHGRAYSLIDVAAMILGYLKEVAEEATGLPAPQAVITVPANFNDIQRSSTRQAGEKAGFEVLRIINEPTAAALAYGFGREKDERVAIYDFGGGTFDMTILEMRGAVYEVLATAGDTMLGGDDFDRRILDDMVRTFQEEHGHDPHANPAFMQRLHLGAERMKCQLSDWVVAGFTEQAVEIGGKTVDFRYDLSRERFNEICADLIEMSFNVCDETLRLAGCTLTSIDQIILVGGTTRVPLVRERVTRYFLRPPLDKIQPDIVVSHGAAIQAFALAGGAAMWPAPEGLDEYDRQQAEARGVAMAIQEAGAAAEAPVPAAATSGGLAVLEMTDEDVLPDVDLPALASKAPSPWDDVGAGAGAGAAADLPAPSRRQPAAWEAIDVV
ncbi:MAG: Hsp70 family protein, partial [Myxococcota bacterium]|nr:Hsp70 family protein [Myxococcota bacterium]